MMFVVSLVAFGQQEEEWLQMLNNPKYDLYRLQQEDRKAEFHAYDFSYLLLPGQKFLGFISSYFRIGMEFTGVSKNRDTLDLYNIKGIFHFGKGNYEFAGTIRVNQVREFLSMHYGADSMYKKKGLLSQGVMIGSYAFEENPKKPFSGKLKGTMSVFWYLDEHGKLCYDDVELFNSDSYKNNQYVGTWSPYGSENTVTCNWGEYRIPFSGDLDIGTAEFSPNPKYSYKGWGNMDGDLPVVLDANLK
jgi:hypothetical protein